MSLIPTHSMSAPRSYAARKTLRPIRPKPLIPTRTDIRLILPLRSLGQKRNADFSAAILRLPQRPQPASATDHLNPKAVGIPQIARVIAAAVPWPLPRCAVVASAVCDPRRVRGVHRRPAPGRNRDMAVAGARLAAADCD